MSIELNKLSYTYFSGNGQKVDALQDISLKINDGDFIGVMGHTGCGKTTLIQLIAGLLVPTKGCVLLDGEDINTKGYDRNILRRSVGIVFQYPEYQLFEQTMEKEVAFGLKHSGLSRAEVESRVHWALKAMGFDYDTIRLQSPLALSGGEKRCAAIAGVLAAKPKVLIFDEPVAGLDPKGRKSFLELVTRLNRDGTTILMVSHNVDALSECAGRVIIIDHGRITLQGSLQEVFTQLPYISSLPSSMSTAQEISSLLRARGMNMPEGIITYDALLAELKSSLAGGNLQ